MRKVEALVRGHRQDDSQQPDASKRANAADTAASANLRALEQQLTRQLGHKVQVRDHKGKGEVVIAYSSLDELDSLLDKLGLEN